MQYIVIEKNFIFMVFLAVKVTGIFEARNKRKLISIALFDVTSCVFYSQKDHEDEFFLNDNILHFVLECTEYHKYVKSPIVACAL